MSGSIRNADGIEPEALVVYTAKNKGLVAGFDGAEKITTDEFFAQKADFFVPAALENQITAETAPKLQVKVVFEGANGPTNPDGDEVLKERGIEVLPDILCNGGGVVVSYFEWLQNKRSERWDLEEVDCKLHKKMVAAFAKVSETAREYDVDWRTAAYIVALSRLLVVYKERGIFP
jgi:glutamate dehydrogenase (NAD(P)+)